jgi:hypothetical protein
MPRDSSPTYRTQFISTSRSPTILSTRHVSININKAQISRSRYKGIFRAPSSAREEFEVGKRFQAAAPTAFRHKLLTPSDRRQREICRPRPRSLDLRLLLRSTPIAFLSAVIHLQYLLSIALRRCKRRETWS